MNPEQDKQLARRDVLKAGGALAAGLALGPTQALLGSTAATTSSPATAPSAAPAAKAVGRHGVLTPINEFESIIEAFWDPQLSGLNQWAVQDGAGHGLKVAQGWCFVTFDWQRPPAGGPALSMTRRLDVPCGPHDRLMVSAVVPSGATLTIAADTDAGPRSVRCDADGAKQEYLLDLKGAGRIDGLRVEIATATAGPASGWFNWIGLQDSTRLAGYLERYGRFDARWEGYLKDESFKPKFKPAYGLTLNESELEDLRRLHQQAYGDRADSPLRLAGRAAMARLPESSIGEYVNFGTDTRYNRRRDHDRPLMPHGLNAAVAGAILQDASLLRLAARYAMSLAMCDHWDDGFICYFPGSSFDHRAFVQSLCTYEVAGILDLAGEYFTSRGRDYLLRRLGEEGVPTIQYNTWRYEYIFACNQLAWFTPGRVLGQAVLERHWPRVKEYRRIAYRELCESVEATVLGDGGYVEGPTYFRCVGRDAGLGLYFHGRAEGKPLTDLAPAAMLRTGDFAEALESTDEAGDLIPICDAWNCSEPLMVAMMAQVCPGSAWTRLARKMLARDDWMTRGAIAGQPRNQFDNVLAWQIASRLAQEPPPPRALVALPQMGLLASRRSLGKHDVKILIQGNKAGAGHTHEDKGSFVLEFAGQTFAIDPGTYDYSHSLSLTLKQCQRHNMLVPAGLADRPAPASPLPADVKPVGDGDTQRFAATIDLTPGWERHYRLWRRSWDSPSPDRLSIRDEYELADGDGVEFYWQSRLPIRLTAGGANGAPSGTPATSSPPGPIGTPAPAGAPGPAGTQGPMGAIIEGRRGVVSIAWPADCTARVDELPWGENVQYRLAVCRAGRAGTMQVDVTLTAK